MSAKKRTEHELEFLTGEKTIMVATSAFGMGIDLDALDLVVHFNMPLSIIDYMQQAGRAGRNGQRAHCILLYDDTDYFLSQGILSDVPDETAQKRALMRLDEIKDYCDDNFAEYLSDMLVRLKKSNPEYDSLLKKQSNLMNKNDRLADVLENHCLFSLSKYEVKVLKNYLSLKEDSREIEEKEIFIQGMRECYFLLRKLDLLK